MTSVAPPVGVPVGVIDPVTGVSEPAVVNEDDDDDAATVCCCEIVAVTHVVDAAATAGTVSA